MALFSAINNCAAHSLLCPLACHAKHANQHMQSRELKSVYPAWIRGGPIFKPSSGMWVAKRLRRRRSRLEMVGSHSKAGQAFCLSRAAAGQSRGGLGAGGSMAGSTRWREIGSDGWTPRPLSGRRSRPITAWSCRSPRSQKVTAHSASCFQPSCFICSPAIDPRPSPKPPEVRETGKGLQHHVAS